jgi:RHS repeat-associated protein
VPLGYTTKVPYNLRFPGQVFDGQAGLHQNGFRDYDPATGRYVESDPIGLNGGINTYTYVDGKPTSEVDPLGLMGFGGGGSASHPSQTPPKECQACEGDDRLTVRVDSTVCAGGDTNCFLAMQAAGVPGPYFPHTNVYSKQCLATMGVLVKPAGFAGSEIVKRGAPTLATKLGASEGLSATIGRWAAGLMGWEVAAVFAPWALSDIEERCECKNGH